MRLAVIASHPTQCHAPWLRAMAAAPDLDVEVLFCHRPSRREQLSAGIDLEVEGDCSMLDGYAHRFIENRSTSPSAATFGGTSTPAVFHLLGAYDAVLVNGWHYRSAWQAVWTCWRQNVPALVRSEAHLHTGCGAVTRAVKDLPYRWLIPRFDACLPVGQWSRDYFVHCGADPARIFTVPHVADPMLGAEATTLRRERSALRARWGLDDTQVVFLFVGRLEPFKRPFDFVRAVAAAHAHDRRVSGLVVGDGPMRPACTRLAAALGAPIRFTGSLAQSERAPAYAAADVLVLPSEREAWALAVDEAMRCGIPCIVSDRVGCGPDLVEGAGTGHVFPAGDVNALSRLMLALSSAPADLIAMGNRARVHVEGRLEQSVDGVKSALAATVRRRNTYVPSAHRFPEVVGHG